MTSAGDGGTNGVRLYGTYLRLQAQLGQRSGFTADSV